MKNAIQTEKEAMQDYFEAFLMENEFLDEKENEAKKAKLKVLPVCS